MLGKNQKKVQQPLVSHTVPFNSELLDFTSYVFTLEKILDILPKDYSTDDDDYHLLSWAFIMIKKERIVDIEVYQYRARYLPGTADKEEDKSEVFLQKTLLTSARVRPYRVRQRRVPVDCGIPHGMTQSPAQQLGLSELQSLAIPSLTPALVRNLSYTTAEQQYCKKSIEESAEATLDQLDQHMRWVKRIVFSATDLIYLRYLLDTQDDYEDVVFSGTLLDYRTMHNSKSRLEQFSHTSKQLTDDESEVLVPEPNRVFTLKAEPTRKYPGPQNDGPQAKVNADWQNQDSPTAPAVFIGLPCPTYWEEMDALRRGLTKLIPISNGQWRAAASGLDDTILRRLYESNQPVSYTIPAPPPQSASGPGST